MIGAIAETGSDGLIAESRPVALNPDISAALISELIEDRPQALPDTSAISQRKTQVSIALMQFRLSPDKPPVSGVGFELIGKSDGNVIASGPNCVSFASGGTDPQLTIRPTGDGAIRVLPDTTGVVEVFNDVGNEFVQEASYVDESGPGDPTWVWVIDETGLIRVDPPPSSTVEVCNGDHIPGS